MNHKARTLAEEFAVIAAMPRPRAIALMGDSGEELLKKARECAAPFGTAVVINGADYKSDAYQLTNEEKMTAFKEALEAHRKDGAIIINNIHEAEDNAIRMARILMPLINNRKPVIVFAGPAEQTQDVLFEEPKLVQRVKPVFVEEPAAPNPRKAQKPGMN